MPDVSVRAHAPGPQLATFPSRSVTLGGVLRACVRLVWPLTWGIRWYWLHSRRKLGKGFVVEHLVKRLLPAPPAGFYAEFPNGGRVFLHHREDIGLVVLMSGGFERAETEFAIEQALPGTVAIDVGANVGMFTVPLALAVGPSGRVLTIEPSPENVERLESNLELNGLENVVVEPIAVGDKAGQLVLQLASDPGFHSTAEIAESRAVEGNLTVRAETLDQVWLRAHAPAVSFIKIDTEGSEDAVLRGAEQILQACHPVLLVEAKGDERVRELDSWLDGFGYARKRRRGFAPGNFVYTTAV
jgi:FkbM family methyltransferase